MCEPHFMPYDKLEEALLQNINSTYILSDNPFLYYLKQIQYLSELDLICIEDVMTIKKELYIILEKKIL